MNEKVLTLYGLNNYKQVIEEVVKDLDLYDYYFDIKLILTESLSNAFFHGNRDNKKMPITLSYYYDNPNIVFKIVDLSSDIEKISIPEEISDEDLLNEHGRGLFLINNFVDEIILEKNTLIIKKRLLN